MSFILWINDTNQRKKPLHNEKKVENNNKNEIRRSFFIARIIKKFKSATLFIVICNFFVLFLVIVFLRVKAQI